MKLQPLDASGKKLCWKWKTDQHIFLKFIKKRFIKNENYFQWGFCAYCKIGLELHLYIKLELMCKKNSPWIKIEIILGGTNLISTIISRELSHWFLLFNSWVVYHLFFIYETRNGPAGIYCCIIVLSFA